MLIVMLAGCSTEPVDVDAPTPDDETSARCQLLLSKLPDTIEGRDGRDISPGDALAAAWGDPAIVLRCGVESPAALTPTSFCFVADDVGWLPTVDGKERPPTSPTDETQVFTTIGRSPYVELTVPGDYADDAPGILADVAAAVKSSTTVDPGLCVGDDAGG